MRLLQTRVLFLKRNLSLRTLVDQILNVDIVHVVLPEALSDVGLRALLYEVAVAQVVHFGVETLNLWLEIKILVVLNMLLE